MNIRIAGDREQFWQWDTGQTLEVVGAEGCHQVHFAWPDDRDALTMLIREAEGSRLVSVPDVILQRSGKFIAYLYTYDDTGAETRYAQRFYVQARPKPDGYVYTEDEHRTWDALDARIKTLEKGGTGGVSSWNDLQDKPFRSEVVEILPEITVSIEQEDDTYGYGLIPNDLTIEAGKEYTVKYNGVEYVCICVGLDSDDLALGNMDVVYGNDPVEGSEPFTLAYTPIEYDEAGMPITWSWVVAVWDGSTSVTLSITGETVTKIPFKFIDHHVWIDVHRQPDGTYTCSTTYGQVKKALNNGYQVTLRCFEQESNYELLYKVFYGTLYATVLWMGIYMPAILYFNTANETFILNAITQSNQEPTDDAVYTVLNS